MVHVLIEVSGGVVTNVLTEGEVTVWLRDYDDLHERGLSDEDAERELPYLFDGPDLLDGFGGEIPPAGFTKR